MNYLIILLLKNKLEVEIREYNKLLQIGMNVPKMN